MQAAKGRQYHAPPIPDHSLHYSIQSSDTPNLCCAQGSMWLSPICSDATTQSEDHKKSRERDSCAAGPPSIGTHTLHRPKEP
jgi:hypothetical protein